MAGGDRSVLGAGLGEGAGNHLGSTLPGVGHPGGSCPILFHPLWLSLHTFPHPLLFSPSPKGYLGVFFLEQEYLLPSHTQQTPWGPGAPP